MSKITKSTVGSKPVSLSNKQKRVVDYLQKNGSIDSKRAEANLGDARLAATVHELRKKGYQIDTVRVDVTNRYGEPTWYGKYVFSSKH